MFILGLGTGRCGTVSLSHLLDTQIDTISRHESIISPWEYDESFLNKNIDLLLHRNKTFQIASDVAFYLLPYCEQIIKRYPDTKCVCLKRDMNETADSYMLKTPGRNHWTSPLSLCEPEGWRDDPRYDDCYPKYYLPKYESICNYWEDYYLIASKLQIEYPNNFRIFDMKSTLQIESEQLKMLTFCGFKIMTPNINIKLNSTVGED